MIFNISYDSTFNLCRVVFPEQVLSLRAELESDLYVFSALCGPSDKDKVDVLVDQ